jgi:hypothetical protein
MHIHRVVQLILKSPHLCLLVEQIFLLETDFGLEILNAPDFVVDGEELISVDRELDPVFIELLLFFLEIGLPLGQVRIRQLYLFE